MTRFWLEQSLNATLIGRDGRDLADETLAKGTPVEVIGPGKLAYDGTPSTMFHAWGPITGDGPYLYRTWEWPEVEAASS